MYRGRGEEEHNAATWEFQCTWLSVDSGSGERGGGGDVDGGRQREEGTLVQENLGSDRDLGAGRGRKREGKSMGGCRHRILQGNTLVRPE